MMTGRCGVVIELMGSSRSSTAHRSTSDVSVSAFWIKDYHLQLVAGCEYSWCCLSTFESGTSFFSDKDLKIWILFLWWANLNLELHLLWSAHSNLELSFLWWAHLNSGIHFCESTSFDSSNSFLWSAHLPVERDDYFCGLYVCLSRNFFCAHVRISLLTILIHARISAASIISHLSCLHDRYLITSIHNLDSVRLQSLCDSGPKVRK